MSRLNLKRQTSRDDSNLHDRSLSDQRHLKQLSQVQQKLRREIGVKFNKLSRHDEINLSTSLNHKKPNSSFFLNNPLTKSSFSMSDAITHKSAMKHLAPPTQTVKSTARSRHKVNSSYRERYSSLTDHELFQTKVANIGIRSVTPILPQPLSAREAYRSTMAGRSETEGLKARNNKFKLLFREKTSQYKTVSQRKLAKIDIKINALRQKKDLLRGLIPHQKPKEVMNRPKPRGEVVKKEKIMNLALGLIKYVELFFNMYQHNNIVGGHLKNVEGFNNRVRNVLMLDANRAKRIKHVEDITSHFWSFKEEDVRPTYFGEEDLALYNILNGFSFKMERKYTENLSKFNYFEAKKRKEEKASLQKSKEQFEKRVGRHDPIDKINKFIEERVRFDQDSREEYMFGLQKRGVRLNIIERSRQLVLRQKQMAMKIAVRNR